MSGQHQAPAASVLIKNIKIKRKLFCDTFQRSQFSAYLSYKLLLESPMMLPCVSLTKVSPKSRVLESLIFIITSIQRHGHEYKNWYFFILNAGANTTFCDVLTTGEQCLLEKRTCVLLRIRRYHVISFNDNSHLCK